MYDFASKQRTGRTTRMLEEALRLSNVGHAVYVVCDTADHASMLRMKFEMDFKPPVNHGVKFENANMFPSLNWQTMTLQRAHPNCRVLVDHLAIERRYARILEMVTRFDEPAPEQVHKK